MEDSTIVTEPKQQQEIILKLDDNTLQKLSNSNSNAWTSVFFGLGVLLGFGAGFYLAHKLYHKDLEVKVKLSSEDKRLDLFLIRALYNSGTLISKSIKTYDPEWVEGKILDHSLGRLNG